MVYVCTKKKKKGYNFCTIERKYLAGKSDIPPIVSRKFFQPELLIGDWFKNGVDLLCVSDCLFTAFYTVLIQSLYCLKLDITVSSFEFPSVGNFANFFFVVIMIF